MNQFDPKLVSLIGDLKAEVFTEGFIHALEQVRDQINTAIVIAKEKNKRLKEKLDEEERLDNESNNNRTN